MTFVFSLGLLCICAPKCKSEMFGQNPSSLKTALHYHYYATRE